MLKFKYLILFSLFGTSILAQNAFWNAVYLHNAIEKQVEIGDSTLKAAVEDFVVDPFTNYPNQQEINLIIDKFKTSGLLAETSSSDPGEGISPLSTGTIIIDGTARFLAERFREETTTLYISKFKEKLEQDTLLQKLLPKTADHLQTANYFDFKALGNEFKDVFEDDLKNLLLNLKNYIENKGQLTDDAKAFVFALDVADGLVKKTHPADLIGYLDQVYSAKKTEFKPYFQVIHTLNLLQRNLRALEPESDNFPSGDNKADPIWISLEDLQLLNTSEEIKYFFAGLYQQDPNFFDNEFFGQLQSSIKSNSFNDSTLIAIWQENIAPILLVMKQIETLIQEEEIESTEYIEMMDRVLDVIELVNIRAGKVISEDKLKLLQRVMDLYQSIHRRDYALVVSNGVWLTDKLLRKANVNKVKIVKTVEHLQRYGTFMVDIVTADDPEAVKEAIKRNVTQFSYLDKRQSRVSFTLMGIPSVLAGSEQLLENENWAFNTGVSCPIGFDLSFRSRKKNLDTSSFNPNYTVNSKKKVDKQKIHELQSAVFGFYIGLIDIGAPFSYRISGSTTDLPENILLKQILSPSLSIYYSFPKSPVTLAGGLQYTPELREIGTLQSNARRLFLRASWDIPLVKIGAR